MTRVSRLVIDDVHLPVVVDPEATDDYVVNCCGYLPPGVVVARF